MSTSIYLDQNYESLRQQCYNSGYLFRDSSFPADDSSISLVKSNKKSYQVYWKRPSQLVKNPKFIVNGIDPSDLVQGDTGNCWFISAASTLASIPSYCKYVIPVDQSFDRDHGYAGIFRFRFWQFGEWIEVVVDDRLPVDGNDELIYCHNETDENEFFGPLLEKAYAKLAKCYEFLNSGDPTVAMTDLTGAVCETFDITKCVEKTQGDFDEEDEEFDDDYSNYQSTDLETLWAFMKKSHKMKSLMNASLNTNEDQEVDEDGCLLNGLMSEHAYSVIQTVEFKFDEKKIRLVKLRDPNADLNAWKGAWGYKSKKWKNLPDSIKEKYKMSLDFNGEFYMSFRDFTTYFEELNVAHVNIDAFSDTSYQETNSSNNWILKQLFGSWKKNVSAGGSDKYYWYNPQYLFSIVENLSQEDSLSSVIISLMQPYSSSSRYKNDGNYENSFKSIKFHLYVLNEDLDQRVVVENKSKLKKFKESQMSLIDSSGAYADQREVTKRCYLESGHYIIIPSIYEHNLESKYLLRIFFDKFSCSLISELF